MAMAASAGATTLSGKAEAIDGDSLVINGHQIRLFGADAFEYHQTCGHMKCGAIAADTMRQLVEGRTVTCEKQDTDRYGRTVAICKTKCSPTLTCDLAQEMVRRGLAVAFRHYSMVYVPDETAAKRAHAGAWAHGFDAPQTWRQQHPRTTS
ncbi:thermonuclease family protein [Asticcacaulis solisilvae]|uniref:thermonuclease family protein n=1 Tax=Asticcacaulis solisilvae TaxID=1217274 RepID=UPI003FD864FF